MRFAASCPRPPDRITCLPTLDGVEVISADGHADPGAAQQEVPAELACRRRCVPFGATPPITGRVLFDSWLCGRGAPGKAQRDQVDWPPG